MFLNYEDSVWVDGECVSRVSIGLVSAVPPNLEMSDGGATAVRQIPFKSNR